MEDVDSEKQKSFPCHVQTPCLQFTKDESKARIHWQAKGNAVANRKQHMVNNVKKENTTSLYSSCMPSAEAKRKHEALLAELRQCTSWLNMYQTTACFATFRHFYQNWLEKDYERARTNASTRKEFSTDKPHYTIIEDDPEHDPAADL